MDTLIKYNLADQVKEVLESYIEKNYKEENLKLPSEKELSEQLKISRTTIRKVLDEFEQKGVIIRLHGRGTFINPEAMKIKQNLIPGVEFSQLIKNSGKKAKTKLFSYKILKPSEKIAEALNIELDEDIYEFKKIYYSDNIPAIISIDYFPKSILNNEITKKDIENINNGKSVFNIIAEKTGYLIYRDKIKIESISEKKSRLFTDNKKVFDNDSILLFTGINYNEENNPIVYDYELYDTDIIQFNLMRLKDLKDF